MGICDKSQCELRRRTMHRVETTLLKSFGDFVTDLTGKFPQLSAPLQAMSDEPYVYRTFFNSEECHETLAMAMVADLLIQYAIDLMEFSTTAEFNLLFKIKPTQEIFQSLITPRAVTNNFAKNMDDFWQELQLF